ncbi:MAG: response regulator transcription factor, partial [Turicibacter sp.]|nr:response regulator transcription factor [Turicibacter sp.]
MKKLLLIEDDLELAKEIQLNLKKWGFNVTLVKDFEMILEIFQETQPMLVILDINLPFFDGFYWCQKIRESSTVPIIFLSSRDSNLDLIMAIHHGGDDYLTKPFSSDILVTKINALMRRTYDYTPSMTTICGENFVFDSEKGIIKNQDQQIELTKNEIKILTALLKQKGKIVSRDQLMMSLWNSDEFISDNTLTVNVNRLRNSLKSIGIEDLIQTKKGIGYL